MLSSLTKGDHVTSFRRSFLVVFGVSFLALIVVGALLDAVAKGQSTLPLSYTEIFVCAIAVGIVYMAILGTLYSSPRYLRRRAMRRVNGARGVVLDLYLTRDLRQFVESVTAIRLNDVVESITFEFSHDEIKIWHGAGEPKSAIVTWLQFPEMELNRLGPRSAQIRMIPIEPGQPVIDAFVPFGVLGIRHRGLDELIASIQRLRPSGGARPVGG